MATLSDLTARAHAEVAALAFGPPDDDCPAEILYGESPYTEADARWAAETCPLDGGWVEGETSPFDLELLTVDALTHFNEHLDPAADDPRWDDWTGRGIRPY